MRSLGEVGATVNCECLLYQVLSLRVLALLVQTLLKRFDRRLDLQRADNAIGNRFLGFETPAMPR